MSTAPDLFNITLTEAQQLIDLWGTLSSTQGFARLIKLKLHYLKLCASEHLDSPQLEIDRLNQLVDLRKDSEHIDQSARSILDETLQERIHGVTAAFATQQGQFIRSLQQMERWKQDLTQIPSWNVNGKIWDDYFRWFIKRLSEQTQDQLDVSDPL